VGLSLPLNLGCPPRGSLASLASQRASTLGSLSGVGDGGLLGGLRRTQTLPNYLMDEEILTEEDEEFYGEEGPPVEVPAFVF
jgi:hypothetical protein